ncbi:MAG: NagC family transcriptional regulator [Candidatus Micrarchaeota archaeon]|nr:NagC family transcriptional regulator [Candidatus Micrarchaeota archaeon]
MMPNMDPRTMKNLMARMGIKSSDISAKRVIIESDGKNIIIDNPQVTRIEAQGAVSFQVVGDVSESAAIESVSITEEDIDLVAEKTGLSDRNLIRDKLTAENGDIAKAILDLSGDSAP